MGRNCCTPDVALIVRDGQRSPKGDTLEEGGGGNEPTDEFMKRTTSRGRSDSLTSSKSLTTTSSLPCTQQRVLQSPPRSSSSAQIRSRFLNRLGFSQPEPQRTRLEVVAQRKRAQVSPSILRGKDCFTFQDLKGDHGREFHNDSNNEPRATASRCRPRAVSFDASVKVHSIPKRTEYSERIRDQLWIKASVQQKNMARNCMEFAAEGWKWQHVEEDMIVCANGEKVHPMHFNILQNNLGWRFCAMRALQQRHHQYK